LKQVHVVIPPPGTERAVLVGHAGRNGQRLERSLDELALLADTAGALVLDRLSQRRGTIHPGTFIGKGKLQELKERVEQTTADLAIFDDDLSPGQVRNLEKALGIKVVDRSELILDIFSRRAQTRESRLQVELAQLEYTLPRLTGMWKHLERQAGGIGTRGPGETQLETDRRAIRRKIGILRKRLEDVAAHRANQRRGRRDLPSAALVGYTNAGKSSLLKALSGDDVFVEDRLFATLDTLTREVDVGEGYRFRLVDTVGFIRKLPHHLVASFRATLEEAKEADLLLHVIDAAHPAWEEQVEVVETVMEEMGLEQKRVVYVLNKADLLPDADAFLAQVRERYPHAVLTSTVTPEGVAALRHALRASAQALRPIAQIRVPVGDGKLLAGLHRDAEVLEQTQTDGVVIVTARIEARLLGKLRRDGVEVVLGVDA
jgi:GTP-binding protein HflX